MQIYNIRPKTGSERVGLAVQLKAWITHPPASFTTSSSMKGLRALCSHLACDWSSRAAFVCGLSKARTRFLMSSHTSSYVDAALRYIWPPLPIVPLSAGVHHHNGLDTHCSAFSARFNGVSIQTVAFLQSWDATLFDSLPLPCSLIASI